MCGIAAIFAYSSDAPGVDPGELVAIRDHMIARGPDGSGSWISPDGRVGLAHRRLSILDLSEAGAQPMWNVEGTLGITFNGEIYNYPELRAELQSRGCVFRSSNDTEVLLHLYAEKGVDMVHDLRGMFAFALWDARRRTLFCARDPFGIKPLYYADDGRTIRLASQVKALLQSQHIDTAPESAGHVGFFLWGHVPDPFTLYRGIRALPAGHTLTIGANTPNGSPLRLGRGEGRGEVSIPSGIPQPFCSIPDLLSGTDATLAQRMGEGPGVRASGEVSTLLRSALRDTVAHHLLSDVPVGVFLSAGLDSTTLTALAAELGSTLRTVTLGFDEFRGTENDEVPLAETVARQFGAQHQTIWVSRSDFQHEERALFAAMDQPTTDGVNTYFVSLAARRAGLKVALSGLGGDELFGGYPSFRDVPRSVSAFQMFRHPALQPLGRGFRWVSGGLLKRFTSPKYAGLLEYGGSYGGAYLLRRGFFMPWELPEFLDPDLVREGWQRLNTLAALNATAALSPLRLDRGDGQGEVSKLTSDRRPISSDRLRVSALELNWYMRNQLLRDSDWAGMAHSLEIRVPLVDTTLLRTLAPALGGDHPPTKLDMAHAPRSPLPAAVLSRAKTGFQTPIRDWLLAAAAPSSRGPVASSPRGLRDWAHEVYSRFGGNVALPHGQVVSSFHSPVVPPSGVPDSASKDFSVSDSQRFSVSGPSPQRIVVYRIGQLGDTIVALPAMWAVRKEFPNTHIALLSDTHEKSGYIRTTDLLEGSGLFDEYLGYPVEAGIGQTLAGLRLNRRLKKGRFDTLVYLAPSNRSARQIARDRWFFKAAGIQNFLGMDEFPDLPPKHPGVPLPNSEREVDLLLKRLSASTVSAAGESHSFELHLGAREEGLVGGWLSRQTQTDGGRTWLAVGPGSKMPAKQWPVERYEQVVHDLIESF